MSRDVGGADPQKTLRIGPFTLRNRMIFPAHLTNFSSGGTITEQHIAYYEARARGGAAMIITEEHTVHPSDRPYEKLIRGWDPAVLPGYRRLTDTVHRHGTRILAQLNHNGAQGSSMYTGRPLWSPGTDPDPLFREVPMAIGEPEIAELVDGYSDVARRCIDGGFDGVEIQCSQASILRAFLASGTNPRTDLYGGDLHGRARLLLEVVARVRAEIGPDHVVGVRLSGYDGTDGGIDVDDAVQVARMLETTGHIDYLNTSVGVATETLHLIEAPMSTPHGYSLFVPSTIRAAVSLPVVGVGRFTRPDQVRAALSDGVCDLVGAVRAQIADPEFAGKVLSGLDDEVRPCIGCNQECIGRVGLGRWIGCTVNPRAGRESVLLPEVRSPGRRVLVVGGGPAGLQAAATAAHRGHVVTLCEREASLGGQVRGAATAPHRAELLSMVTSLEAECLRAGVEIRTGIDVVIAVVEELRPDAVIVATGARPLRPAWAGESQRVVDVRDVLEGRAEPSGRILVVDDLGFHEATSVAELLADRGCDVTVCTPGMIVGQDLGLTLDMDGWLRRAHEKGIGMVPDVAVAGLVVRDNSLHVSLVHHPTGKTRVLTVDGVVVATHQAPVDELWTALSESGICVSRVGDAVAPRRAHAAILEGDRAALELGV
ncbi:mycofactocin system FadH/OYE family oxidoreductase 2 [Rhodococcus artemisiae]|uniref:Mycofactocin system FadH/OYE family oxidoreductase 2 n=1 Tax=Rhodococcus artemisiae TaxID=714159 RepID=A0ABU7LD83_9NOCA|nr:mycofactocin system FadH/OYE family oxidoreductase 2 [Rhodococcus artemisiae]MEE2059503.1 mycofactocin system FadH/OYE family oxidoreductase 2 [Rhodococcus artemisiae]